MNDAPRTWRNVAREAWRRLRGRLAALIAPSIVTELDPDLAAKFNDPAYRGPATERWIPAVQQALRDLRQFGNAFLKLGGGLSSMSARLDLIDQKLAEIKAHIVPGPVVRVTISRIEAFAMDFSQGDSQFQDFAVGGQDAIGALEDPGAVVIKSSDETIATCAPSPANVSAPANTRAYRVSSTKKNTGTVQFTVMSPDQSQTYGVFNVNVTAGPVVAVNVQPIGMPEDLPA